LTGGYGAIYAHPVLAEIWLEEDVKSNSIADFLADLPAGIIIKNRNSARLIIQAT
jgi:hypothetical protein